MDKTINFIILFLLSVIYCQLISCKSDRNKQATHHENTNINLSNTKNILEYGIPVDSFNVVNGFVKRDQTLGNLLINYGVKMEIVNQLPLTTKDVFDIRHFKAGNRYKAFYTLDSLPKLRYLIYEDTQVDYYIFDFSDSLVIRKEQKKVEAIRKLSEATISTSLWETMQQYNLNPVLALDLSEIFAWTVDFFGLYPGDKFKVYYDELYVDGAPINIGTIFAARFEHRGETYYAFRFSQDSTPSYWDEKGNSLRKSFLKAPLRFSRISSRFSGNRFHPVLKIYRPHTGVDYAAPVGTPVMSIGDGVVIEKGYTFAAGNYLKIRHNSVYTTGYNHFSKFGKGIEKGVRVSQGQIIGYVGQTGYATGSHLDLRFWMNGKPVDPLKIKAPPVEPIKPENLAVFLSFISDSKFKLDSIAPQPVFPENAIGIMN